MEPKGPPYLVVDTYSVFGQFMHIRDEEFGVDLTVDGKPLHIPSLESAIENAEGYLQNVIDKLDIDPQHIIAVCDPPETGAARKRKFAFYKATRSKRPAQYYEVFNNLINHMTELVMKSGGVRATPRVIPSVEGDDLVHEICRRLPHTVCLSTDKDLLSAPATHHYIGGEMDPQKFPVPQGLILTYRAVVSGDASDGIPSCKGFGEKAWEQLLELAGPDGMWMLKDLIETRQLDKLAEDVPHMKKLQLLIDQADQIYASYECMSPMAVPAHKVKWEARVPECPQELVTADNYNKVYQEVKALVDVYDHVVIDYEADVCDEARAWVEQTKNEDGRGGVGIDVIGQQITGMGLKVGPHSWYFSVAHCNTDNITLAELEKILRLIQFKRCYAHNSTGYENVVTYLTFGFFLEGMLDTKLMASYVDENDYMGLKPLTQKWLGGYEQQTYDQVIGDRSGMFEVSGEEVFSYGVDDVLTCDSLQNLFTIIMMYEGTYDTFLELEWHSAFVTSLAFANGIGFDWDEWRMQREDNNANIARAEQELEELLIKLGFGEDVVYRPLPEVATKSSIKMLFEAVTGKQFVTNLRSVRSLTQFIREEGYEDIALVIEEGSEAMNSLYKEHWRPRANLNVRSPKQMQELMYTTLECPVRIRKPPTDIMLAKGITKGNPAANEEAIANAIAFGDVKGLGKEALEKLIEYKGYLTKESLFYAKFHKFVHWKTGRIHCNMTQCGASTRRFTHTPNLAQLPKKKGKEVRNMIVAQDGFVILANDFDSQELKLQAEDSQCPEFLKCYLGKVKQDVHCKTGYQVAIMQKADVTTYEAFEAAKDLDPKEDERSTKPFRASGKATNFSTSYLCKAPRLAHMLCVTEETAQAFIDAKDKAFPGLMPHINRYIDACQKRRYSLSFMGARRHLAVAYGKARSKGEIESVDRLAWSFRIQGSGAEQIKLAMSRAWKSGIYRDGTVLPVVVIHDELVNQVHLNHRKEMIPRIHACVVANYANMTIPAGSTPEVGKRLGELKKWDLEAGDYKIKKEE